MKNFRSICIRTYFHLQVQWGDVRFYHCTRRLLWRKTHFFGSLDVALPSSNCRQNAHIQLHIVTKVLCSVVIPRQGGSNMFLTPPPTLTEDFIIFVRGVQIEKGGKMAEIREKRQEMRKCQKIGKKFWNRPIKFLEDRWRSMSVVVTRRKCTVTIIFR